MTFDFTRCQVLKIGRALEEDNPDNKPEGQEKVRYSGGTRPDLAALVILALQCAKTRHRGFQAFHAVPKVAWHVDRFLLLMVLVALHGSAKKASLRRGLFLCRRGHVAFFGGTFSWRASSVLVQTFTYIVTDLTEFESEPVDMEMETDEEAVMYGALMAGG